MAETEAKEDLHDHNSNTPEYPDATKYPEIPKNKDKQYDWPTTRMAGLTAKEYWNPEMTRLEDNEPSSMLHN